DFNAISNNASRTSYEGVAFTPSAVANGAYAIWGYEHIVNRAGGLSANQVSVRNALIAAITDTTYQHTVPAYADNFVAVDEMQVERGTDGGPITSLNF